MSRPAPPDASFSALVLAGSRPGRPDPLAQDYGIAHKCLIPAGGIPMLVRVVGALAASSGVDRIFLSLGDKELLKDLPALEPDVQSGRLVALTSEARPSASVLGLLESGRASLPLLITTADHALLSPEIVERFLGAARTSGADAVAALTPASVLLAAYPQSRRTFIRFRDGPCSGANLFAILSPEGRRAVEFWRRVEQERKRPWRLVRAFGLWSLASYLCGRLSLDDATERASAVIGARVAAVRLPIPEAAIDVDKADDLRLVESILRERGASAV